ncbi:hypothetical protein KGY79_10490 [Candidatus Bipolaricaulota bacterium]|nr:hypothetical protein [Candidatus Bipolaricaulota bacterium]
MHQSRYSKLILALLLVLFTFATVGGGIVCIAQDSDGDLVPDDQDEYPGRNDLKYGGTLTLGTAATMRTFNTHFNRRGNDPLLLTHEAPFIEGHDTKAGWIEDYEVSDDGKVWTVYLEEGVKFHDGEPLDAEAFAWNLRQRISNEDIFSTPLRYVEKPEDVVVVDENTVKIVQSQPNPNLRPSFSDPCWLGAFETPNYDERYGDDYGTKVAHSNGPFKLTEWVKGDHMVFERFEEYSWAPDFAENPGPPYLKEVKMRVVPEMSTRLNMLKTGELDGVVDARPQNAKQFKDSEKFDIIQVPSTRILDIEYNTEEAPLDELEVRKALNYAVNRPALAKILYYGFARPAYSLFSSTSLELEDTKHLYKFDREKASSLLKEAGWKDEDNDGIREKNGKDLKFNLIAKPGIYTNLATAVQGMWREVGVRANVRTHDEATALNLIKQREHDAVVWDHAWPYYDLYYWWFNPDYERYPNMAQFDTPKVRELIKDAKSAKTFQEFKEKSNTLVNYVYENASINALLRPTGLIIMNEKKFSGYRKDGHYAIPLLHDAYSKEVYQDNKEKYSD